MPQTITPTPSRPRRRRPSALPSLVGLAPDELVSALARLPGGARRFRGEQVFRWLHRRRAASFDAMTDLPEALRAALAEHFRPTALELAGEHRSRDAQTRKLVLRAPDGVEVEAVGITAPRRVTLCVSSQAGCALGCTFCRTARMGLVRNLEPGEIVDQVLHLHRQQPLPERYNLVFMGMGEPLANYERVVRAIELLARPEGLAIGPRRITISTVGLVPEIRRLAREHPRLRLAVSLVATTDALRDALMPVNRRYPLRALLDAVGEHARRTRRRVTFEYVMLAGVNDSLDDARRLARLTRRVPSKINLIPFNGGPEDGYRRPAPAVIERFVEHLHPRTYAVTVRATQGRDILAACGMLARGPLGREEPLAGQSP